MNSDPAPRPLLTFDELVERCYREHGVEHGMTREETRHWVEIAIAEGVITGVVVQ